MAFDSIKTVFGALRSSRRPPAGVYDVAQKAKTLIEQGEHADAIDLVREGLERFPGHSSLVDVSHFLAQKQVREALAELRAVVEEARQSYVRTARAYADTDDAQKAIEFLTGAFRRFPESPELHLILGEVYLRQYLADKLPEDGMKALESLERAYRLDPGSSQCRKYLAGLYARIGCYGRAGEYLAGLETSVSDEEEQRYIQELRDHCSKQCESTTERNVEEGLERVSERGAWAVDCGDWASPPAPRFGPGDLSAVMVPFAVMEMVAKKYVAFPGVAAVLVENEVRSETVKAEGVSCDAPALERIVREVADKSADACRRMGLGGVRRCELKTTVGPLSIHQFQDTRLGLLFREGASTTQVRTVTQQCLDLMVETMGQIHENHS